MKKKLLSALLALVMVLSLLPTTAFAAAEGTGIISSVGFAYRRPTITPEDSKDKNETARWQEFDKLRNVFVVWFKTRETDTENKEKYQFAVKAADDQEYQTVTQYYYTGTQPGVTGASAAYFEAPTGVLKADKTTYRVKVTVDGKAEEKDVELLKLTLTKKNNDNLVETNFVDADKNSVQKDSSGAYSIFAEKGDTYIYLPNLKDGTEGGGNADAQFVGWANAHDSDKADVFSQTALDDNKMIYAVFGVKPVMGFVLMNEAPANSFPESNETEFATTVSYGDTASAPISIYIVNIGNQDLGNTATESKGAEGFCVMSNKTDHFTLAFDVSGNNGAEKIDNTNYYLIKADKNSGKKPVASQASYLVLKCTPNENLPAGTYTDTLTINTPTRRITQVQIKVTVNKKAVAVTMPEVTKEYGQAVSIDEQGKLTYGEETTEAPTVSDNVVTYSDLGLTLTSAGFNAKAAVTDGESGHGYTIFQQKNGNYDVTVNGEIKVKKARPNPGTSVQATAVRIGDSLDKSSLSGAFVNPHNGEPVEGELTWNETRSPVSSQQEEAGVECTWKFTPAEPQNYEEVTGQVKVQVWDKNPTKLTPNLNENKQTVTYDGQHHRLDFSLTYTDAEDQQQKSLDSSNIQYSYRTHDGAHTADGDWTPIDDPNNLDLWPKDAGTWDIKAYYAGDNANAPVTEIQHLIIEQKEVSLHVTANGSKTYDGTDDATSIIPQVLVSGKVASDDPLTVEEGHYTAQFNDPNVGTGKQVTVTVSELSGTAAANYKLPNNGVVLTTGTITAKELTLSVDGTISKNYGQTLTISKGSFTGDFVEGDSMDSIDVEFTSGGTDVNANAGQYPITAKITGGNYTLKNSNGNVGQLTVNQSELNLSQEPTATDGYKDGNKGFVQIVDGVVVNKNNPDMIVSGTWALTDNKDEEFTETGTATLNWKFTTTDSNYTGELTGTVTVNVLEKQPVTLKVKDSTALTVTYDGEIHELKASAFETEESVDISIQHNEVPQNVGTYNIIVTATPTGDKAQTYAAAKIEVKLNITQATVPAPNWSFSGLEGTALSDLKNLPTEITGVDETAIKGTFEWDVPSATITDENGSTHNWTFTHDDPNHVNPVTGSAKVTMAADDRKVEATVYNLPAGDYAVVKITESGLKPDEKVVFYKDEACTELVSAETTVPGGNATTFTVPLNKSELSTSGGSVWAKIVGKKTTPKEIEYLPELGFTLPNGMVLLHVGGSNANTPETVSVVLSDNSYSELMTGDTWTVTGGANLVEITNNNTNDGSATFRALAAGTAKVTVTITFKHPDTVNHPNDTISVPVTVPLNITTHYVVFTDETVENGTCTADPTEADNGTTITVTLKPNSGYRAETLKVYPKGEDGKADTTQDPIPVTGSGNSYTFTMPANDVVLVPEFTQIPSGGGSFGGGGAGGGGASGPSTAPETDNVITPEVTADASGEAKAPVDAAEVESAVESAKQSGADEIVVEPQVTGDADKVSVELEKKSVDAMADGSDLDLTVKTDAANVTLPGDSLDELADKTGSKVTVSVEEKTGGEVGIEVAIDGKPVETLSGGLKVDLPKASGGNVLVIVGADGSETIVKKSIVENGHAYAVLDGSCSVKIVDNSITFADVASADWYSNAVDFASSHELFKGVGHNNFAPNAEMTRAMVATVLWRFESGEHVDAAGTFADVAEGEWYTDGIAWASEHNIITGYTSGTFGPQDNVTREQLATMLYRYAKDIGMNVSTSGSLNKFSDSGEVSAYAQDALRWAVGVGLIKGNPNNTINPDGYAKRSEVATIFMRFCELITK